MRWWCCSVEEGEVVVNVEDSEVVVSLEDCEVLVVSLEDGEVFRNF